jgi:HEAT repeat protein
MFLFGAPNVQKLSAKRDVQGLIKALGYEKDEQIRHAAALALGQIGDPRALEPLIAASHDSDPDVRQAAVEALGQVRAGGPSRR